MHRKVTVLLTGLFMLIACGADDYTLETYGKFEYTYLFKRGSKKQKSHFLFLKNFDYMNSDDLLEIQKFAIYYYTLDRSKSEYPLTCIQIVDRYYPSVEELKFEGITVNIYFVERVEPVRIRKVSIFRKRERLDIPIPLYTGPAEGPK